jgi:predicted GNAT family N-acyltransferase
VRTAQDATEVHAALELRHGVFCGEQGVAVEADRDGRDGDALHVVATAEGRVLGTCRVVFDGNLGRLGRMAVEPALRGRGIGAQLLDVAEREARAGGARRMRLHAQTAAVSLYERGGYDVTGREFVEEGIAHVPMEKRLA